MNESVENRAAHLELVEDPDLPDVSRQEIASQPGLQPQTPDFENTLTEMIEKEVARRFQSAKDKRWAALEKIYGDLHELSEQAQAGLADAQADPPEDLEAVLSQWIAALASLPGIRENEDALALLLLNQHPTDLAAYTNLVEELLRAALGSADEGNPPVEVSAASAVTPSGGQAPNDLEQAYQRRKMHLRPGDVNALTALKREFRQKGLDVF